MTFNNLNLHPQIIKALIDAGYEIPTPIQSKAIPEILKRSDIKASAQTGTGKTAAFLLPALHHLTTSNPTAGKGPRILILVPTRELALQVEEQAKKYSKYLKRIKTVCVIGGVPYHKQISQLSRPYDILIATPGRLIDLMDRRKISFSRLDTFILDEADRMLDMGFLEPVEQIADKIPAKKQTLFFSATLQGNVAALAEKLLNNPIEIAVNAQQEKHEYIEQQLFYTDNLNHKNRLLDHLLQKSHQNHTIIFTATKKHADHLVRELKEKGHDAGALHGDMHQRKRTRVLASLKATKIRILVATDVAARGIDVRTITHIINFDLPNSAEDYVHRIGRTGRAGAKGIAISFASRKDRELVKKIEKFTGNAINIVKIPGLEPQSKEKASLTKQDFRKQRFNPKRAKNKQRFHHKRKKSTRHH